MDEDRQNPFGSDRVLVDKLWEGDEIAWRYVLCRTVLPMSREDRYYWILEDRRLSAYDVLGMVFDLLIAQKKLALFRFRCPLFLWIRHYVTKAIYDFCRKNPNPVSDEVLNQVLSDEAAPEPLDEEWKIAQICFRKLWRKNPMRAYVHLLMVKDNMSAKEIVDLLSLSSEGNVYQLHSRAIADMRSIRSEVISGGER